MKPIVAITMGDPAGIGAEITVKALCNRKISDICVPVVVGDYEAIIDAVRFTNSNVTVNVIKSAAEAVDMHGTINLINLGLLSSGGWEYKKVSAECGKAAYLYIEKAIHMALEGEVSAVITGPLNKEALNLGGYHYSGHTEIFATLTNTENYAMLLIGGGLRVIHVSTHVSMREACEKVKRERVHTVIKLAYDAMRLIGIEKPRIAVAGLNPHCSENGLFGNEEELEITPAIEQAVGEGRDVEGPVSPDTVFVKAKAGQYDVVVAMYHDQGHIPLKLAGFKLDLQTKKYTSMAGVNCTVGLPIIRSSVDHGTAFGKAGEGRANEESMVDAIKIGVQMASNSCISH